MNSSNIAAVFREIARISREDKYEIVKNILGMGNPTDFEIVGSEYEAIVYLSLNCCKSTNIILSGYDPENTYNISYNFSAIMRNEPLYRNKEEIWSAIASNLKVDDADYLIRVDEQNALVDELNRWMLAPREISLIFDLRNVEVADTRIRMLRQRATVIIERLGQIIVVNAVAHPHSV